MKKNILLALLCGAFVFACSDESNGLKAQDKKPESSSSETAGVDYTLGRTMNARLGKGINLGNAWDGNSYWDCGTLDDGDSFTYTNLNGETKSIVLGKSESSYFGNLPAQRYNFGCDDKLDGGWGNAIKDDYFAFLKAAGFNSIRLPVRWQHNSDPVTHKVNPERLAGVMDDVQKAINAGLIVIISFHWYYEINFAANHASTNPDLYEAEKVHFASIWNEVASAFEVFPDSMLVWDILNEPTMIKPEHLNEVMTLGYNTIRAVAPGKTIMFESYQAAKFEALEVLNLPKDGNIIYSGHYYEPYEFSHQGHQPQYKCIGDAAYANDSKSHLLTYVKQAKQLYPDINGSDYVPLNMGEFGISGGTEKAKRSFCKSGEPLPSAMMKAKWATKTIEAAELYGISWHYWGFVGVGGFEAYDKNNSVWYEGFPAAFGL